HRRGGGDRNEDPLGPNGAFAGGGPRRPVGATEWTAMRLGFQPALGPAWFFVAGVAVYEPYLFFAWWCHFDAYAPGIFLEGAAWATGGAASWPSSLRLPARWR